MEQTSAFVTVFAGSEIWCKSRAKTRAKPVCGRTHRQLIRTLSIVENIDIKSIDDVKSDIEAMMKEK